jgi:hypothetical protein
VVLGHPFSPGGPDGADGVVGSITPAGEGVPEELEFGLQRSDAHACDDAPAAQHVEGAQPFHQFEGVVVGQHGHVGEQAHPRRLGGEVAQRREGVEIAAAAHRGRHRRDGDVFGARHPAVAELLRLLHHPHHIVHSRGHLPLGRIEARVHVQRRRHDAEGERHSCNVSARRPFRSPGAPTGPWIVLPM